MKRPLVAIALCFALGIVFSQFWLPSLLFLFLFLIFFWALAFIAFLRFSAASVYFILTSFFLLGLFWSGLGVNNNSSALLDDLNTNLILKGTVIDYPSSYPNRTVYTIRTEKISQGSWEKKVEEKVQLTVFEQEEPYRYGDVLQIKGVLRLPPQARNPHEFDYRDYLWRRGIHTQITASSAEVVKIEEGRGNSFISFAYQARDRVVDLLFQNLNYEEASILGALLFGDTPRMENELKGAFSTLGLMHAFSVSGLHVGFVLLFMRIIAALLKLSPNMSSIFSITGVFFYALVTGFSPPVVRAALMISLVLTAPFFNRKADSFSSLAFSFLLLLILNPFQLFDVGFQYSFLATGGILALAPIFKEKLGQAPLKLPFKEEISVVLGAQLTTFPLSMLYFNLFPFLSLLVNVFFVPLIGVIVIIGLAVFLFALIFPPLAIPLILSDGFLLHLLLLILKPLSLVPGVAFEVATPALGVVLLLYILIFLPLLPQKLLFKRYISLFAFALLFLFYFIPFISGELKVVFLDVGQGDAIFISTPAKKTILIDGGGYKGERTMGELVVNPFLLREGVDKLDLIISTHPDSDHLAGLLDVVEEKKADLLLLPAGGEKDERYGPLIALAHQKNVSVREVKRGDRINLDPALSLEILNPPSLTAELDNDSSVVLKMSYGSFDFLFTGDLEKEGMQNILRSQNELEAEVLKFPHHGSKNGLQENFLKEVRAKAVVISAGENNNFGHPSPEVIEYFGRQNIPLYRTDQQGAVIFFGGAKGYLEVETILP